MKNKDSRFLHRGYYYTNYNPFPQPDSLKQHKDKTFFAEVEELPGCMTEGIHRPKYSQRWKMPKKYG